MFNEHFPPEHKFHKTFNRNLSKLSYYYYSKYLKNLQLFKGKALSNKWFISYYTTITSHQENYTKLYKRIFETTFKKCYEVPTYTNNTKIQPNIGHLKQISLTQMYHGKSKGDTSPTDPFSEDATCVQMRNYKSQMTKTKSFQVNNEKLFYIVITRISLNFFDKQCGYRCCLIRNKYIVQKM